MRPNLPCSKEQTERRQARRLVVKNAQNHPISSEEHQRRAFAPRKKLVVSKMREEQEAHEENKCCRNFGCEGSTYVLEANGLSENQ